MPTNISTALTSGITLTSSATTITSTGSITDNGAYDNAVYGTLAGAQYIENQGKILGSGTGIFLATPGTIVNESTISQTGGTYGFGIYLGQGGTVVNNAGALISGYYGIELTGGGTSPMPAPSPAAARMVSPLILDPAQPMLCWWLIQVP